MGRKTAALVLCLLLILQLAAPAGAAETVYYTAVNENVLELDAATMPFWSSGSLYVPSTVFRELGLGHSRNLTKGVVMIYDRKGHLLFDLNTGTAVDERGIAHYPAAIRRGSVVFLPASLVAETFGIRYNGVIRVSHGYLARFSNKSAVLTDAQFVDAASVSMLETRYQQYIKSKTPAPAVPPPPRPVPPELDPEEPLPPDKLPGKQLYLCMAAGDSTGSLLEVLEQHRARAALFFTPEQLEESGDLLRRLTAGGHAVGILADAGRRDLSVRQQLDRANQALWNATCGKTRLVRLLHGTDRAETQVKEAGFCLLRTDLDRAASGLSSPAAAETVMDRVDRHRGAMVLWLGRDVTSAGLSALLDRAAEASDRCIALTETAA